MNERCRKSTIEHQLTIWMRTIVLCISWLSKLRIMEFMHWFETISVKIIIICQTHLRLETFSIKDSLAINLNIKKVRIFIYNEIFCKNLIFYSTKLNFMWNWMYVVFARIFWMKYVLIVIRKDIDILLHGMSQLDMRKII